MERQTALDVFDTLERERLTSTADRPAREGEWDPPAFDVRLDGLTDGDGDRRFRVRVQAGRQTGALEVDHWRVIFEVADEHGLHVDVQNAGLELA